MKANNKTFDAVEMKNQIQEQLYEITKNMTPEEQRAYYRQQTETGPFADKIKRIKEQQAKRKKAG